MGRIVAIANPKGLAGKTALTAVKIAAAFAKANKKVLLIDSDPQGISTRGLDIAVDQLSVSAHDVYTGEKPLHEIIRSTRFPWLDIVPAKIDLAGVEIELIQMNSREQVLKKAIAGLKNDYDLIFIDCPPSLGLLTINALTAADGVIIQIPYENYDSEELASLTNVIRLVKQDLNPALVVEGLIPLGREGSELDIVSR